MKLIINADDFGASENVNRAIVQAFQENLISSATIMTNMLGFERACGLIECYDLYGRIGIHLNLTAGYPITEKMSMCKKFCDTNGKFKFQRNRLFWLDKENKKIVYNEFEAQLNRLLDKNIIPTHIDSHHHYHTEWAIGKQVIRLAQKNNIGAVRLSRNCGGGGGAGGIKKIYKNIYNQTLFSKGLSKVQYFGSVKDVLSISNLELYNVEIMVHPGYDKKGRLVDLSTGEELYLLIQKIKI